MKKYLLLFGFIITGYSLFSQNDGAQVLSEEHKFSVISKAISLLHDEYVFPERVQAIEKKLQEKIKSGGYSSLTTAERFLEVLNTDLENAANDKHVNISYGPARVKQILLEKENEGKIIPISDEFLQRMHYENFRLRKVERMEGNIGYFRFLNFPEWNAARESITAAMNFIRFSSSIIIDLRDNGGGYSETLNYLLSYFLKGGLKIGEFHYRKNNRTEEIFIPSDSGIHKIPDDIPVYILVSKRTSSAAEGMASVLQENKRAVIVGENTKGEGNPGELFIINEKYYMMIPTAVSKSVNPHSKPVEGAGISPDIAIAAEQSLDKALLEICRKLAEAVPVGELKQIYEWQIPVFEFNLNPTQLPADMLVSLEGYYQDGRSLIVENNQVYYMNKDKLKTRLNYIGKGIFGVEGKSFLRVRVPLHENPVRSFEFFWDDGFTEKVMRVKADK